MEMPLLPLEMAPLVEGIVQMCLEETQADGAALYVYGPDGWSCLGEKGHSQGLAEDTTPESLLVPLGKFCLKVSRRPALDCEQIRWVQGIAPQLTHSLSQAHRFQQLQDQLLQAQQALRLRTSYLAGMSHELRTPLNAVLGFCQMLLRNPETTVHQVDSLQHIQSNGKLLLDMIGDVVESSRLEAGLVTVKAEPFQLIDQLQELETSLAIPIVSRGGELTFERDENLPPWLIGDAEKLGQIVRKTVLVTSRLNPQGMIRVNIGQAGSRAGECQLDIVVEDASITLDQSEVQALSAPFSQGQRSGGSGLELTIATHYATLLGGSLNGLALSPGLRWTIRVSASVDGSDRPSSSPAAGQVVGLHPQQPPVRVLVVDDVAINRFMLTRFLMPLGFEVREAQDGQQAIDTFTAWAPQVILTDLVMPGISGTEVIARIRALETGDQVVVFAVTGAGEEESVKSGPHTAQAHLTKPVDLERLLQLLQEHLQLRFVYRQPDPAPTAAQTGEDNSPPAARLGPLLQAARLGDVAQVQALLQALQSDFPECQSYLRRCLHLADDFDFARLEALLQP